MNARTCLLSVSLSLPLAAQTWSELLPGERYGCQLVYDSARDRRVLFGGISYVLGAWRDDTWEHDGMRWRRVPTPHPSPRTPVATYDRVRQRVVAVQSDAQGNVQTFEYDGVDWRPRLTAHAPLGVAIGPLAYDTTRNRCVLFATGTAQPQTWEYDGVDWGQRVTATVPDIGTLAMAYDEARQRMVMAGTPSFPRRYGSWEYDGNDWTRIAGNGGPFGPGAMTYDTSRQAVVFCGQSGTWERQGNAWTSSTARNVPYLRRDGGFTYDSQRQVTVLYGGQTEVMHFDDLWTCDGATWRQASEHPQPMTSGALAYDPAHARFLVFGHSDLYGAPPLAETWVGDGVDWTRLPVGVTPPARFGHALVFAPQRRSVVLFGGMDAAGTKLNDTWSFDGTQWQPMVGPAPSARHDHALAYDSVRGCVVLFGGTHDQWPTCDDTWELHTTGWRQVTTPTVPAARFGHAMVFDSRRGVTVVTGGHDTWRTLPTLLDSWEYDGRDWRRVVTAHAPPARYGHSCAFVPSRGEALLFGGNDDYAVFADLWRYDGSDWTFVPTAASPYYRERASLAYDSDRDRLLLLGGRMSPSWSYTASLADSWQFDLPATAAFPAHGLGCAGSAGTPTLTANNLPTLGTTLALRVTSMPPTPTPAMLLFGSGIARWNGAPLPVDLTPLGLAGCQLWIEPAPVAPWLAMSHACTAAWSLSIPNQPALAGAQFGVQALVLDAAASNGIGAVSNAGLAVVH